MDEIGGVTPIVSLSEPFERNFLHFGAGAWWPLERVRVLAGDANEIRSLPIPAKMLPVTPDRALIQPHRSTRSSSPGLRSCSGLGVLATLATVARRAQRALRSPAAPEEAC